MRSKLLILLLSLLMAFSLVACETSEPDESDDECSHKDANDDGVCDKCDEELEDKSDECTHADANDDGICDKCDEKLEDKNDDATKVKYTVTWIDENGDELAKTEVEEGSIPSYTYTKDDTAEWDYTVLGWSLTEGAEEADTLAAVTANTTYYACVTATKQTYTVSFNTMGATAIDPITVEYGATVTVPEDPEYRGYRFVGWYADENFTSEADFTEPITSDITVYACFEEKVDIVAYLETLLAGYELNPYAYVPIAMRPDYAANLVDPDELVTDYSSFVNVSDIRMHGYGEQWNMVIENLEQSKVFFNALAVVETLTTSSVVAFRNYVDANPADTAQHSFESGIYTVTISFDGDKLFYVLDYTATFPAIGEQTAQIALVMDVESGDKSVRVQLGDANALTYTVTENSYEFAIRYLGVRRAYFGLKKDALGNVSGHIYEYLTAAGVEIASAADFYISDDYVTAVGNKADGIPGFTGYICELYDANDGRLVGYEVREELSSLVYNTLWFDLDMIDGINSIKYREKNGNTKAAFFVNGGSEAFETKNYGGIGGKILSRRFDIEFRTQYFYSYDEENDTYVKNAVQVPMMFIQEEKLGEFESDVKQVNSLDVSVNMSQYELDRIMDDYDTCVDVFVTNKELVTVDIILAFIGEKIIFE